jgi:deazaflavin-dependent oxidoreductase (nitroreductase family)
MAEKKHAGVRRFNRAIFNRVTRLFAGRLLYGLVFHVGRRTGQEYTTPVVAEYRDGHIHIPLPYGTDTDWYLNLRAAGYCRIKIKGRLYTARQPELIGAEQALPGFSPFFQKAFRRARIQHYLRLEASQSAPGR